MSEQRLYTLSFKKIIIISLVAALIGSGVLFAATQLLPQSIAGYNNPTGIFNTSYTKLVEEQSQTIDVVSKVSPAVVSIVASAEVPKYETYFDSPSLGLPEEFEEFFNFRVPRSRQNGTEKVQVGAGTGFIVSADGYIVTNKHVVTDEKAEYVVYLNDEKNQGEKVQAKVLALDPNNDLAILKIEKTGLPYLEFGDSSKLQVGQTAITIGYALGEFDNTVSKGIVSGLSRSITVGTYGRSSERLTDLIQTDAAINPGNSGGPMLDIEGKVIGINVAMATAENIGFAIPANAAKESFEEVKRTGTIAKRAKAFLGIRYLPVTETLQAKNKLPYDYGALVVRGEKPEDLAVAPGSPADKAGIVENDIILEVDGKKLTARNQLADVIVTYKPGDTIRLKIYHQGKEKEVSVTL